MFRNLRAGQGWAYAGLLVGLAVSVTGNITNTVMVDGSHVPLWLRVPFAMVWPVFTWLGIEILTRTQWREHWTHWFVRAVMVGPVAGVAAFVSYLHLHHLMAMAHEPGPAQAVGPIAIDTMLLGCTVVLIITRQVPVSPVPAGPPMTEVITPEVVARWSVPDTIEDIVPVSPDAIVETPDMTRRVPGPRTPRTSWDIPGAVRMIFDGDLRDHEIAAKVNIGPKMIQRARRACALLKDDPDAVVPAEWKVPTFVTQVIRAEVPR